MPTWKEAIEAIRQDIVDINNLKDARHAVKQTALVKSASTKDFIKTKGKDKKNGKQ